VDGTDRDQSGGVVVVPGQDEHDVQDGRVRHLVRLPGVPVWCHVALSAGRWGFGCRRAGRGHRGRAVARTGARLVGRGAVARVLVRTGPVAR
jgi:hypothetical protein